MKRTTVRAKRTTTQKCPPHTDTYQTCIEAYFAYVSKMQQIKIKKRENKKKRALAR